MVKSQDFTRGGIISPLVRFALPVLLAMFLQTMYGAVDLLVVGQFARSADVSAVSTGSQIMMTVTLVINSLAMGLTVLVARCIGAGQPKRAGGDYRHRIVAFRRIVRGGLRGDGPPLPRPGSADARAGGGVFRHRHLYPDLLRRSGVYRRL